MNFATKSSRTQALIWVIWLIVLLVALFTPATAVEDGAVSLAKGYASLEEMGLAALPGLAAEISSGTAQRSIGSPGAERLSAAGLGGGAADQTPAEVPNRGLASAVCPAGNTASAADHQSPLSHAGRSGARDGGVGAGDVLDGPYNINPTAS